MSSDKRIGAKSMDAMTAEVMREKAMREWTTAIANCRQTDKGHTTTELSELSGFSGTHVRRFLSKFMALGLVKKIGRRSGNRDWAYQLDPALLKTLKPK